MEVFSGEILQGDDLLGLIHDTLTGDIQGSVKVEGGVEDCVLVVAFSVSFSGDGRHHGNIWDIGNI